MKPQIIKALILFLSLQMSDSEPNPWHVDSLQAFWFLKCPECAYDTQEEEIFREHALENHPRQGRLKMWTEHSTLISLIFKGLEVS